MLKISMEDTASKAINELGAKTGGTGRVSLTKKIAYGVGVIFRKKFRKNSSMPNRLNAPSTGYWQDTLKSISTENDENFAGVSFYNKGIALQYFGGTVRPKRAKNLAIPMLAAFHGKTPREFPRETFYFGKIGRNAFLFVNKKKKNASPLIAYLLTPKATIRPQKDKFPTRAEIKTSALNTVKNFFKSK